MHDSDRLLCQRLGIPADGLVPLVPGASAKRYYRVPGQGSVVLLTDSATASRTIAVAAAARDVGLRTPEVIRAFPEDSVLVLEDVGEQQLRDIEGAGAEYATALSSCLGLLARIPELVGHSNLRPLRQAEIRAHLSLYFTEFRARYVPDADRSPVELDLLSRLRRRYPSTHLALADVSPDNIMVSGPVERESSYVFIDIQDAFRGPRGFDLISLVQDVRSDKVPFRLPDAHEILRRSGGREVALEELAVLSLFRLLRIVGVFARLDRTRGSTRYMRYMPHVKREIADCLSFLPSAVGGALRLDHWP